MFAWKFRGAVNPDGGSVRPVGDDSEVQGTTADVIDVEVLQYGEPEGPPSP